jgi:hypothetical protein
MKTKLLLTALLSFSPADAGFCRKLLNFCLLSFVFCLGTAQTPQGFNYQAIARDGSGNPIAGATINVKLSILTDTAGFRATGVGVYIWEEEHLNVSTNAYGLFTIVLGDPSATKVNGSATSFSLINWSLPDLYIGTKIANPSTYKVLGAAKLWSVPYALRAKDSDQWQGNGTDIYRLTGKVGIGTSTPLVPLSVYNPGSNTTIHIGSSATGQTYLSAGTSASTNGYSYLQSVKTAGTAYGDLIFNNSGGNVGIGTTTPAYLLDVNGSGIINSNLFTPGGIELGITPRLTGNRFSGIDFHGDDTYTDYALRIIRYNTGPDALSQIEHHGTGIFNIQTDEAAPITFSTSMVERFRITPSGNVGIGMSSPTKKVEIGGTSSSVYLNSATSNLIEYNMQGVAPPSFTTRSAGTKIALYPGVSGTTAEYALGIDASTFWMSVPNNTGNFKFYAGTSEIMRIMGTGNVGIGTTTPASKMVIQPPATWDDNTPLFEVRNKYGTPVLAVYNNGVRILVAHDAAKGVTKGGFAIGGFDNTKAFGETVNLMTVAPDSIRFNIDNDNTKGITKGGFAIGGFDVSKGINVNPKAFMNMTPLGSPNGQYNTFLGYGSGKYNTTGIKNAFIGYNAGLYNRTGNQNVIVGTGQIWTGLPGLTPTDLGSFNTFVGYYAGGYCSGIENTAVGNLSGANLSSTSNYNSFFGRSSGNQFYNGIGNVFVGNEAGIHQTSGSYNTYLGAAAGWDNVSGSNNVFIGTSSGDSETGSDKLYIGSYPLIYGDFTSGSQKVRINGNLEYTGTLTHISDIRIKKNIREITDVISKLTNIHGVTFEWDLSLAPDLVVDNRIQVGVIAQEVEKEFPELISTNEKGFKMVDYTKLTPILIQAIKEQQIQIESTKEENQLLKSQLQSLQEKMDRIEAMLAKGGVK